MDYGQPYGTKVSKYYTFEEVFALNGFASFASIRKMQACPAVFSWGSTSANQIYAAYPRTYAVALGAEYNNDGSGIPTASRKPGPYFYDNTINPAVSPVWPTGLGKIRKRAILLTEFGAPEPDGKYNSYLHEMNGTYISNARARLSIAVALNKGYRAPHAEGRNYHFSDGSGMFLRDNEWKVEDWSVQ